MVSRASRFGPPRKPSKQPEAVRLCVCVSVRLSVCLSASSSSEQCDKLDLANQPAGCRLAGGSKSATSAGDRAAKFAAWRSVCSSRRLATCVCLVWPIGQRRCNYSQLKAGCLASWQPDLKANSRPSRVTATTWLCLGGQSPLAATRAEPGRKG